MATMASGNANRAWKCYAPKSLKCDAQSAVEDFVPLKANR